MKLNNGKLARAHGLPKIHKEYSNIPKFRLTVDTTGTPHYSVGKLLIKLKMYHLICLTMDTTMYLLMRKFYSQNVPIILKRIYIHKVISTKRIYIDKVISTNLKKRSMKRLLLDTCTKIAFTFNGGIYE